MLKKNDIRTHSLSNRSGRLESSYEDCLTPLDVTDDGHFSLKVCANRSRRDTAGSLAIGSCASSYSQIDGFRRGRRWCPLAGERPVCLESRSMNLGFTVISGWRS